jgi:hypothetical protein
MKIYSPRHQIQISCKLHAQAALLQYPLGRKLGGPQRRSGRCGIEKNPWTLLRIKPRKSSLQPVDLTNKLEGNGCLKNDYEFWETEQILDGPEFCDYNGNMTVK